MNQRVRGGIYVEHVIALLIISFFWGQENKVTTPHVGVTLQSVPVSLLLFFFNTEKYTNLFMLSFFSVILVVGVQQFIAFQSKKKKFCKYVFSLLFLQ